MNAELIVIRLLHIVPGVVWAGSAVLMALVIGPRLKGAGSLSDLAVYGEMARGTAMVMNITGALTIIFGLVLTMRMDGFSLLFSTGWGWTITFGFVLAVLGMGTSGALMSASKRLTNATSGSSERSMMSGGNQNAADRVVMIAYVNAVLVVVAVGAMAAARFV
ncbi:MAG: hypothetical protein O2821_04920 [Chloroflexi bacterium]|nr:hypothetical protein [Chloroflexota bacterium]MDA1227925.1 hypothetical protein [Chloroflexota bacterium]